MRALLIGLAAASAIGLGGCYYDPYGYGYAYGAPVYYGYGYGAPYYGWYGHYYYPGAGIYVYDSGHHAHVWTYGQRSYWMSHRYYGHPMHENWSGFSHHAM